MKYKFFFFLHNAIAHPLLCLNNRKSSWPGIFHDYTAKKMGNHEKELPTLYIDGNEVKRHLNKLEVEQKPVEEKWVKERDTQSFPEPDASTGDFT